MIDDLLAAARSTIGWRPTASELPELVEKGALVIDIRPIELRQRDGRIPGAIEIDRNVLEWRLDPVSPHRIPEVQGYDQVIVLVCDEGYASTLAAATLRQLGLHRATDLDGGYQAWLLAG